MLKVHAKRLGTIVVLRLRGRMVNGETETLRTAVHALSAKSAVILDLARVTTVDAHGLGMMLELREQTEAKGVRFELMNLTKWVSSVLKLTRLDTVFRINNGIEFFPAVSHGEKASLSALRSCA